MPDSAQYLQKISDHYLSATEKFTAERYCVNDSFILFGPVKDFETFYCLIIFDQQLAFMMYCR